MWTCGLVTKIKGVGGGESKLVMAVSLAAVFRNTTLALHSVGSRGRLKQRRTLEMGMALRVCFDKTCPRARAHDLCFIGLLSE